MAQRLDTGIAAWADDVGLLGRFQAFERQPPDPVTARRLLEDLRSRSPTFSWIGFPEQVSEAAREVTARLNAALNEGLPTPAGRLRLGCSVGIALLRHDAPDFETAMAMADAAL
jgi:GGDEF domain-containing protein